MATRLRPEPTPALDALRDDEHTTVLRNLLDAHPELRPEAEQTARHLLEAASIEALADDVSWALDYLPLEDLAARSGPIRGRGYVHENEAAWGLVSEAVEPFIADLRRRARLGLAGAAAVVATGIAAGLYQAREAENGTVVAYAGPDALSDLADGVLNEATKLGLRLPADAAENYWPEWGTLG